MEKEYLRKKLKHTNFDGVIHYGENGNESINLIDLLKDYKQQLDLPVVVGSSDKIVIEFSDNEILIVTKEELQKMQESAIEYDGFESWIVKGRLV